jgi:hypothetical protein
MAMRVIDIAMCKLFLDPTATIDKIRTFYAEKSNTLTIKTIAPEVVVAAIDRGDADMVSFCVNEVGITGGVGSTILREAFLRGANDSILDVLDAAFKCKKHAYLLDSFVGSTTQGAVESLQRAMTRYGESPSRAALSSLVTIRSNTDFEKWLSITIPCLDDKQIGSYCIKEFDYVLIVRTIPEWEQRLNRLVESGFVLNVDVMKATDRHFFHTGFHEFVLTCSRKRGAYRGAATKKAKHARAIVGA